MKIWLKLTIFYGLVPVVLLACSSSGPKDYRTTDAINTALESSISSNQILESQIVPDKINQALLPGIQLDLPGQTGIDVEPRFDIKVNQTSARQFFIGLVEGTSHNMVVHPKVKGKITLDLKNVSVKDVMEVTRDIYGFDYELTRTAYHVFPDAIRSKIFKLDYLAIKRAGQSKVRVSSGQVSQKSGNRNRSNNNNSFSSGNNNSNDSIRDTIPSSSIKTSSESDFWSELRFSLHAIIGKGEGRNVVVSPHSGVIVVRAMPAELRSIDRYLKTTQERMHRQVLLEARVIEVSLSDGFQSGINWAALKQTPNSSGVLAQTGIATPYEADTGIIGGGGELNPGALFNTAFGGIFTAAFNIKGNFAAFIELLQTQGDVQVLSSPQVSTLNNQKAVIKVGTDEFFITDINTNTNISSATSNTQNNVELTPFFSGVALDVIPQISDDNSITLHIHPTVVTVTEEVKDISLSEEQTLSVPLAVSSVRESDSIIRAQSGQVVIIGGLMKNKTTETEQSVPFLGDIPIIGSLFKHTRELTVKSELVILLKPTVIETSQQWAQGIKRSQKNIRNILRRTEAVE
ncbi:MSHA biogenesis protein MshL [hydrothermal vent metagenome]|uniref:MSHA biogenesis protein MshL n=1 Tax=hydrothermal vent metagenome TaxID=652676 RepID=A0A3B0ZP28_9ZZZZ